jgi:hypothetical protein
MVFQWCSCFIWLWLQLIPSIPWREAFPCSYEIFIDGDSVSYGVSLRHMSVALLLVEHNTILFLWLVQFLSWLFVDVLMFCWMGFIFGPAENTSVVVRKMPSMDEASNTPASTSPPVCDSDTHPSRSDTRQKQRWIRTVPYRTVE